MSQQLVTSRIENIGDLSALQEGMLFHALADPASTAHVVQQVFLAGTEADGPFDPAAVGIAVQALAVKHAILRTAFAAEGLDRPRQVVLRERELGYTVIDLRELPEDAVGAAIDRILAEDVARGFDLARDPLLRVTAIRAREAGEPTGTLRLVWTYHHIVLDGWSLSTLFGDFLRYYREAVQVGPSAGDGTHPVLGVAAGERGDAPAYAAYVRHLAERPADEFDAYWAALLHDGERIAIAIPSPGRGAPEIAEVGRLIISSDSRLAARLTARHASRGATLAHITEASWGVALSRIGRSTDVIFGKVVSGRDVALPGIEKTVGLFINTIPVRIRTEGLPTVSGLVDAVRDQAAASSRHDHGSLARVQSVAGVENLVTSLFAFENFHVDEEVVDGGGLTYERSREETGYPLTMTVQRVGDELSLLALYDRAVLTAGDVERLAARFLTVLEGFAADGDPTLDEVGSLLPGERERVGDGFDATAATYPRDGWIGGVFAEAAAAHAERVALVHGEERLTYAELAERAGRVAGVLAADGIGVGDLVGLTGAPGVDLFTGLLGIALSGAAYVPIDLDAPVARAAAIVEDAGLSALVCTGERGSALAREAAPSVRAIAVGAAVAGNYATAGVADAPGGGDTAYVMFTSGTTGRPKGSVIPQRAVLRLVCGNPALPLGPQDVLIQTGSVAFDASTFEVWGMWLNGGTLVIPSRDDLLSPDRLGALIKRHRASVMWLTVSLFNQYAITDPDTFTGLDRLLIGGEAVSPDHVRRVYAADQAITIINGYGPTENTTFTTTHPIPRGFDVVPIGRPIAGTGALILDGSRLCGIGEAGELCATGDGLSTGYLGMPDLTAERFTPNPHGDGLMYRTGDLVRRLADGTIEYLGRVDDAQVKIRGYRIELGDIETALREHPDVRDTVVTAVRDGERASALAGYVVPEATVDVADLRAFLGERLPAYMVPAHLLVIDTIPLTRNGKIDRRALPVPAPVTAPTADAPETEAERVVCAAFAHVLGLDAVGVTESFFELGGDSITAIRVVSRIRRAGFEVGVGAVMAAGTARGVAARLAAAPGASEERGETTGPVGTLPIVAEFLRWDLPRPEHFNQDVLLDLGHATAAEHVRAALDAVWAHHDGLRAVLDGGGLTVRDVTAGTYGFEHHRVDDPGTLDALITSVADRLHADMDLTGGPLLRAALFTAPGATRLFLAAHHLVVDAVSWHVIGEDLRTGIEDTRAGRTVHLPAATASLHDWAAALASLEIAPAERRHWERTAELGAPLGPVLDGSPEDTDDLAYTPTEAGGVCEAVLDPAATTAVLTAGAAYHARAEDVLLAALAMAVADLTRQPRVTVRMEGHGRTGAQSLPAADRSVGWFTAMYPVVLSCADDPADALVSAKEAMRAVPGDGLGFGLLPGGYGALAADLTFNYLGARGGDGVFGRTGTPSHPGNRPFPGVRVTVLVHDDRMRLSVGHDTTVLAPADATRLTAALRRRLGELTGHCHALPARRRTPSDYTVAHPLSRADLRRIETAHPRHAEIGDLTPLQEGMLFHSLDDHESGAYVVQQVFLAGDADGPFDIEAVRTALRALSAGHAALRTAFPSEGLERPRQVVLRDREITYTTLDLRALAAPETETTGALAEEVSRGFDPARDPLMRVLAIRSVDGDREVVRLAWTYHHIIMDGWSLSTLFGDFLRLYSAAVAGADLPELKAMAVSAHAETPAYAAYVKHLAGRPTAAFDAYWTGLLDGYEGLPGLDSVESPPETAPTAGRVVLSTRSGLARRLTETHASRGVTLAHLAEAAWGLVLGRLTGSDDVVFGKVVSGRDVAMPGIEKTVGLFVNTIPVRVRTGARTTVADLVAAVRDQAAASADHDHGSLTRIRSLSGVDDLVTTVFAFENYHVEDGVFDGGGLAFDRAREETNYPVAVTAQRTGDELELVILHDPRRLEAGEVRRVGERLLAVLEEFASGGPRPLADVAGLAPGEDALVASFNDTAFNKTVAGYPRDGWIGGVFAEAAAAHAERVALVHGEERLTYAQLADRAGRVAAALAGAGVGAGACVGITGEPGVELFTGLLGIVLSGAAYVPIDVDAPVTRAAAIAADAGMSVVVAADARGVSYVGEAAPEARVVEVAAAVAGEYATAPVTANPGGGDTAYVMFTSGTTGRPKGSVIPQRAVLRLVCGNASLPLSPQDVLIQTGSVAFDASTFEVWGMWLNGGTLIIPSRDDLLDPARFGELIRRHGTTIMWLTVSLFNQYAITDPGVFAGLDRLLIGGEAVSGEHVHRVYAANPTITIINGYGPTENTTFTTTHPIPREFTRIPIGRPIGGTGALVLDGSRTCGIGEIGELCATGDGLSTGYLAMPDLTTERFTPNPHGDGLMYRTGDRARWLPDGTIEYLGRVDDQQVKLRGYRIELGDIETALRTHPDIRDAIVIPRRTEHGTTLTGYAVTDNTLDTSDIRAFLTDQLPSYMVPAHLMVIDTTPLTRNGKIDRRALPDPDAPETDEIGHVTASDALETEIAAIWAEVLGHSRFGVTENFFEIGGTSVGIVHVNGRLGATYPGLLGVGDLFAMPTIALLAKGVRTRRTERITVSRVPLPRHTGDAPPVGEAVALPHRWDDDLAAEAAYALALALTGSTSTPPDLLVGRRDGVALVPLPAEGDHARRIDRTRRALASAVPFADDRRVRVSGTGVLPLLVLPGTARAGHPVLDDVDLAITLEAAPDRIRVRVTVGRHVDAAAAASVLRRFAVLFGRLLAARDADRIPTG